MIATLSFIASYWQWLLIGLVATVGLAYVGIVLRYWKAALIAVAIVLAGLGGQALYTAGFKACQAREVVAENLLLRNRLATLEELVTADAARAAADAAAIEALQNRVLAIPPNPTPCLTPEQTEPLRQIK